MASIAIGTRPQGPPVRGSESPRRGGSPTLAIDFRPHPGYEVSAVCRPARGPAGDLFDVDEPRPGAISLCVADVAGKGWSAAVHASRLRRAIRTLAAGGKDPRTICGEANRMLCRSMTDSQFATCFYAELDPDRFRLTYTNAGHNPPILVRRDGSAVRLSSGGGMLGAFSDWTFEQDRVELRPGDRLLLFTDGLTEARDRDGREFGDHRLLRTLRRCRTKSAAAIRKALLAAATTFAGGCAEDDVTLLVVALPRSAA